MHSCKYFIITFLFISLFISCSNILLPELEVIDVSYDNDKIKIQFSAEISSDSIHKSISLLEDGSSLSGQYQCQENQVYFFPKDGIKKNYDYDLSVTTMCEDKRGNSLTKDFHYSFSTREEKIRPQILSISPNNQQYIDANPEYIDIIFSESISKDSFIKALNISPSIEYFLEFYNNDTEVHIIPIKPLKLNTDYFITINTELSDLSRNTLLEDYKCMFYNCKNDIISSYTVSAYENDMLITKLEMNENTKGIPTNCSIRIDFEKQMDLSAVSAYFYFSPTLEYKIIKDEIDGKYVIFNISNAEWNTKYDLTILSGLPDIYGQRLEDTKVYSFTTNNEKNNPPCFVEGIIQTSEWQNDELYEITDFSYLCENKNFSNISFSDYYKSGESKEVESYLIFYTSTNSEGIDIYSLREGFSVSTTNSCCQLVVKTVNRVDVNSIPNKIKKVFDSEIFTTDRKVDVFNLVLEITNTSKSGEIHFILDNGIKDTLNNSLDRKYDFILNK